MVTKFKTDKKKSIVVCIHNILDTCQSGWSREVCINLTDFLIHRFDLHGFDIYIGKNEDELLNAAADEGYLHAVIIGAGTSLGLSDRLFPAIEEQCTKEFFISGHILDRGDHPYYNRNACFELHQQMYIINLADYNELGRPFIGKEEWVSYSQVAPLRSEEYMYDDPEIPVWIKPGTETKTYSVKLHGWNILNQGLLNNKTLIDLGQGIRQSKTYLYYEHDHVFLNMLTKQMHNQFFCNNFFAGWNSDTLQKNIEFEGPVDQYITVGIGFNWIRYLQMIGFTENTKVIFTDINYNCLMFMKAMVENWNGEDYAEFYWQNKPLVPNNSPYIRDEYKKEIAEKWEQFVSTIDNWHELWAKIKQLTYDFILIDYQGSYNLNWIEPGKKTLINLSDVFTHAPYVATQSLKYRIAAENRLFQKLTKVDPNIVAMLTSRATDGFEEPKNTQYFDAVSNFKPVDITKLKQTPWQDWRHNSGRPLGID